MEKKLTFQQRMATTRPQTIDTVIATMRPVAIGAATGMGSILGVGEVGKSAVEEEGR